MNIILNWIISSLHLVCIITKMTCKGKFRDIVLYFNNYKVTRISKLIQYDLFVMNTNNLKYIKYRMVRNQNKSGFLVLNFSDAEFVRIEFTNSLIRYLFKSNRYFIPIQSDEYIQLLSLINRLIISGISSLINEIDNRHLVDNCIHMYDDTIQIKSKVNVFNLKLSQLQFATDDIDTDHDFYIIKNINNIYFVIPIDQLYSLRDNTEDYIFITRSEYINNILYPLQYFSPSENIICYNDYRNISKCNPYSNKYSLAS